MRKKHICISAALALSLALAGQAVSFAAEPGYLHSAEEMEHLGDNTLEWSEIDGLIQEYNLTVLQNRDDLNKNEYKSYTSEEMSRHMMNQADDMDALADSFLDTNAILSATYRGQAESLRIQAESNVRDFEVVKLEYQKIEKQTIESARTQFLNYHKALAEKEYADTNVAYMERLYHSAEKRKSVGIASEMEVLSARENYDKARANAVAADTNINSFRNGLLVLCGWAYGADAAITGLPELNPAELSAVDYEADKNNAAANNITLKIDEIKLRNAQRDYAGNIVEQSQKQLNTDKASFETSFESKHSALLNACTAYSNAVNDRTLSEKNMSTSETQHRLGMISALEYEGAANSLAASRLAERKAYIDMISAKAAYDAAVAGLV